MNYLEKFHREDKFIINSIPANFKKLPNSSNHFKYYGKIDFKANGVFHNIIKNKCFARTFEMENTDFELQLEFFDFEFISENQSKLTMHIIYRSVAQRDAILKMPFAMGISFAHDRLETIFESNKGV